MGKYQPYQGICLVDTFELAEGKQVEMFAPENTERVKKQQKTEFFVIIGNPPYNANQQNEMDLNKNRQHKKLDNQIKDTYIATSKSVARTTRKLLFDPYVKAIRWASDRIGDEGIVAFVTNNSFLDSIAFDGMRKHLGQDFSKVYVLDLGGNVRQNPKLSGTTHNVFGIQVGVSINLLVKKKDTKSTDIFYASVGEDWRKEAKYRYLDEKQQVSQVEWQIIAPDKKHTWLTEGLHSEFDEFIPLGSKEAKTHKKANVETIFSTYALGIVTNKDAWLYNFNQKSLANNVVLFCETYNGELDRWNIAEKSQEIRAFLTNDETKIKWSSLLIDKFKRGNYAEFDAAKIRCSLYRPFTKRFLYFDKLLIDASTLQKYFFPTINFETENRVICCTSHSQIPFVVQIINYIPCLDVGGRPTQCFPFYTYNEDGTNRTENITDWVLNHYQNHYKDNTITKWAIFHYVYGLLHHPTYREKYAANLKREIPRLPMAPDFWAFAKAGEKLADLHLNYEHQAPYPLKAIENQKVPFSLKVEKMRLSKDKQQLKYNDFLTLDGIPSCVFEYKLGNRSALEWVIDQYRLKVDKRSGIVNDPNRPDDEAYILELLKKVITVSLETLKLIDTLPSWKN
jgi:predicted helicase